jgi:hypothetical protein
MASTDRTTSPSQLSSKILNGLLLIVTSLLGVVVFFAILEILLIVGQFIFMRTIDSTLQRSFAVVSVRNFWMLCGGGLLIAFVIGGIEFHIKRLGRARTRSILLRTLAIEIVIIAISLII